MVVTCGYTWCWARSGLSFSPQRLHARSTVVRATLFALERALKEKFLRHPALFSRAQPPGEKCGLEGLVWILPAAGFAPSAVSLPVVPFWRRMTPFVPSLPGADD